MIRCFLAYIDPGVGSILLQMIIGSVVGAGLFFRQGLGRLVGLLWRGKADTNPEPPRVDGNATRE